MSKKNIVYNPKTLEMVERYRELLFKTSNYKEIMRELGIKSRLKYDRLIAAYKDIYYNEDVKVNKLNEYLEKILAVERRAYQDLLDGASKPKEYNEVLEFALKQLARFGIAPDDVEKIQIEHKGNYQVDLITHFKEVEKMLIEKKKALTPNID